MARQSEDTKQSKYVIRIICEGEKTEPLFFTSLCDKLIDGSYDTGNWNVRTIPQPDIPEENTLVTNRGWYKKKEKKIRGKTQPHNAEVNGQPPLSWVLLARKKLTEGVDEAWAVFDKDEHPAKMEAFEEAGKVIDGKVIHIAFSSRSFEYYLLLHFEYVYHSFVATECGERVDGKKVLYHCMANNASKKSCKGDLCINGYARSKKYWKETKTSESTFPLVEERLRAGIINANRLRAEGFLHKDVPIYERNPYTDVDKLICRLLHTTVIEPGKECFFVDNGDQFRIRHFKNIIVFYNKSKRTVILSEGLLKKYNWKTNSFTDLNERLVLKPGDGGFCFCDLNSAEVILIERTPTRSEYIFLPDYNQLCRKER